MKRFFAAVFFFLGFCFQTSWGSAARIVSLTPSATEMLFAIGAGSQVVGVTTADDYPSSVKMISKVGGVEMDEEKLLALKPDLVIGESSLVGNQLARLRGLGVKVLSLNTRSLQDIPISLLRLGKETGHPREALSVARDFSGRIQAIKKKWERVPHLKVFVELGSHPLLTTGRGTFLDGVIQAAGGENIGANLPEGFQMISDESVVANNPDVIIAADGETLEQIAKRNGWSSVSAVRQKRVFSIDPDLVMRPSPRIILSISKIAAWLHPSSREFALPR